MKTYLVVAAVRIQDWIARTPKLTLVRGASAALQAETSAVTVGSMLDGRATVCHEAGDVDGVVVVELSEPAQAGSVADSLLEHLMTALPAIVWDVWWTSADSYVSARAAAESPGNPNVGRRTPLPALSDFPPADTCAGCRAEPAGGDLVSPVGHPDGSDRYGPDCARRQQSGGAVMVPLAGRPARTFDELARLGGLTEHETATVGRGHLRNHLATIAADGNRMGSLFKRIGSSSPGRIGAVATVNRAAKVAVERTAAALAPAPEVQALICQYVGGDDILVTVPAPLAWRFAGHLAVEFEQALIEEPGLDDALRQILADASLGIGVTFAHASHPFAQTQRLAHDALRAAKTSANGDYSAVSWIDLTVEEQVKPERAIRSDHLRILAEAPGSAATRTPALALARAVVGLGPTARGTLASFLTDLTTSNALDRCILLRNWNDRNERPLADLIPDPAERSELATKSDALLAHLSALTDFLSLARWWPAA